ncbi:MAG TPA: hypothetical protein VML55_22715 [Planctomycetaceae bacterium]|nr:hypothetical protein [Planctomycetaceae bacterium]
MTTVNLLGKPRRRPLPAIAACLVSLVGILSAPGQDESGALPDDDPGVIQRLAAIRENLAEGLKTAVRSRDEVERGNQRWLEIRRDRDRRFLDVLTACRPIDFPDTGTRKCSICEIDPLTTTDC